MASGVVVTVINAVAMMAAYPVYLHFLGYEKYGVWLVLATVLNCGAYFGNLGVSAAITKFVAEGYGRGDVEFIEKHLSNAFIILFVVGLVSLAVIGLFSHQIVDLFRLTDDNRTVGLQLLPYVGALTLYLLMTHVLNAAMTGLGRLDISNYIQSAARVLGVLVTATLLAVGLGVASLVVGCFVTYLAIHLATVVFIGRMMSIRLFRLDRLSLGCIGVLLKFGGQFMSGQLFQILIHPFNKLMLSRYVGVASVPFYEIAYNCAMMLRLFIETGLRALTPEISRLSANRTIEVTERIKLLNRKAMILVLLGALPVYIIAIAMAPVFLTAWLRGSYDELIAPAFRVMAIGSFLSLLGVPADNTVLGLGAVRHCMLARAGQAIVNVAVVIAVMLLARKSLDRSIAYAVTAGWLFWSLYLIRANRASVCFVKV